MSDDPKTKAARREAQEAHKRALQDRMHYLTHGDGEERSSFEDDGLPDFSDLEIPPIPTIH